MTVPKLLERKNAKHLLALNRAGQLELLSLKGASVKKDMLSTNKIKDFDGTVYGDTVLVAAVTETNSLLYIRVDANGEKHISKITDSPRNSGGISDPVIVCLNGQIEMYFITRKENVYPCLMSLSASVEKQDWQVKQIATLKTEECKLLQVVGEAKAVYISALVDGKHHIYSSACSAQGKWTPLISVAIYDRGVDEAVFVKTDRVHSVVRCGGALYADRVLLSDEADEYAVYTVDDRLHVFYRCGEELVLTRQLSDCNQWERVLAVNSMGYRLYRTESECFYTFGFDFPQIEDAYTLAKQLVKSRKRNVPQMYNGDFDMRLKKLEEDIYMHERVLFNLQAQMKQCINSLEAIRAQILKINLPTQ